MRNQQNVGPKIQPVQPVGDGTQARQYTALPRNFFSRRLPQLLTPAAWCLLRERKQASWCVAVNAQDFYTQQTRMSHTRFLDKTLDSIENQVIKVKRVSGCPETSPR